MDQFQESVDDIDTTNYYKRNIVFFTYIKRIVFIFPLVMINSPQVQIIIQLVLMVCSLGVNVVLRPYQVQRYNLILVFNDVSMIIVLSLMYRINELSTSVMEFSIQYKIRMLGNAVIFMLITLILLNWASNLYDIYVGIKDQVITGYGYCKQKYQEIKTKREEQQQVQNEKTKLI